MSYRDAPANSHVVLTYEIQGNRVGDRTLEFKRIQADEVELTVKRIIHNQTNVIENTFRVYSKGEDLKVTVDIKVG